MNGCRSSPLDTPCSFCYYADMSCKSFPVFHAIYHFTFLYRILDFTHNLKKNPKIMYLSSFLLSKIKKPSFAQFIVNLGFFRLFFYSPFSLSLTIKNQPHQFLSCAADFLRLMEHKKLHSFFKM